MFYKFARLIVTPLLWLFFGYRVTGRENVPATGPLVVCCNHRSLWDPVVLGVAIRNRQLFFMAKEELFRIPVLRSVIKALGAFPVTRGKSDIRSIKRAFEILRSGRALGIFPQGTRVSADAESDIKTGAALIVYRTRADVLPVAITYGRRLFIFRRAIVRIGRVMRFDELGFADQSQEELKRVSGMIFGRIREMCEGGHDE